MGLIPRPFLDDLLSQTDIVGFIDGYLPLKKQGNSFVACCPFHSEKTPSFNVIAKKQFYHCFGCGASGNAISFAMNYLNLNFSDAVETLAARMGLNVPRDTDNKRTQASLNFYQLLEKVCDYYQKILHLSENTAQTYLSARGVSGDVIQRYQLGYAPEGWHALETANLKTYQTELITTGMLIKKDTGGTYDRYRQRLMFPIHDRHGRIIGFGGRALDDTQKPKYLNSPETLIFQKNRELYGLHQALTHSNHLKQIIVVEGYMDVIALAQMDIPYAVATLGTTTSTYHVQLLAKHTSNIVFCFDGDHAGQQAAWRALEHSLPSLDQGLDVSFVFLPEQHDPDSFIRSQGREAFLAKLEKATTLNQFFFETLSQDINISTLAGKSQLIHKAKPYLQKLPEGPYRQLLLDELAKLSHLEIQRLEHLLVHNEPLQPQASASTKSKSLPQTIKRTPMRLATALILQHPELYASIAVEFPATRLASKPLRVLNKLMALIEANPLVTTASLIEVFRDLSIFDALNQLATWDIQIPAETMTKELKDTLLFLIRRVQSDEINSLIERARHQELDESERTKLQAMLKNRHHIQET